jgi:hypothetical protein
MRHLIVFIGLAFLRGIFAFAGEDETSVGTTKSKCNLAT